MAPEHSNGFRPGRGTTDSLFIFLQTLRKRKEHQQDSWVLMLDAILCTLQERSRHGGSFTLVLFISSTKTTAADYESRGAVKAAF
jgi:hypothetical protein